MNKISNLIKSVRWGLIWRYRAFDRIVRQMPFLKHILWVLRQLLKLTKRIVFSTFDTFVRIIGIVLAIWIVGQVSVVSLSSAIAPHLEGYFVGNEQIDRVGTLVVLDNSDGNVSLLCVPTQELEARYAKTVHQNVIVRSLLSSEGGVLSTFTDVTERLLGIEIPTEQNFEMKTKTFASLASYNRYISDFLQSARDCEMSVVKAWTKGNCVAVVSSVNSVFLGADENQRKSGFQLMNHCVVPSPTAKDLIPGGEQIKVDEIPTYPNLGGLEKMLTGIGLATTIRQIPN